MGLKRVGTVLAVLLLCVSMAACKKDYLMTPIPAGQSADTTKQDTVPTGAPDDTSGNTNTNFTEYFIPKGQQNCLQSRLEVYGANVMEFDVLFDSSAIYTTINPANQADINKLYGFSDCGDDQHSNSARFGWRYYKSQLQLLAYTYDESVRDYKLITAIEIGKTYRCKLIIDGSSYRFYVDGANETVMKRGCDGNAVKFRLFPYFGGDELAPHDVRIKIREIAQ